MSLIDPLRRRFPNMVRRAARFRPRRIAATLGWFGGVVAEVLGRRREARLTVAIDIGAFWEPLAGIGWYLYRTLEALADRDDLRLRLYGPHLPELEGYPPPVVQPPSGQAIELVSYSPPEDLSLSPHRLAWFLQKLQKLLVAGDGNKLLYAPNYLLPSQFRLCRAPVVATVHDLGFLQVPWTLDERTLKELSGRLDATLKRSRLVLTDSEAVRTEMLAAELAPPERVRTVHLGPGQLAEEEPAPLPPQLEGRRWVLHVGTLEPRKNVAFLLQIWRLLRERRSSLPCLVLCGQQGWKSETLMQEIAQASDEGWLLHLGYVPNDLLATLYRQAFCVLFPSLYEGFGFPALEAQAASVPLLASDIPVLREVAGKGALYAPPDQAETWVEQLERLLDEPGLREKMILRGERNRQRFHWETTAESLLSAWRDATDFRPES